MNLIEQQNILRGLPDEALPQAMQSGETPPFLVLSEIGRRKSARERYEGNRAKYAQTHTSVAEDMLGSKLQRPGLMQRAAGAAQPAGGLDAVAPAMGAPQAPPMGGLDAAAPGFANGGMVQGYAYGGGVEYADALQEKLSGLSEQRDRARAMAIIAAGAGMMGGKSSNTLTNIGAGLSGALPGYQQGIEGIDRTEMDLLRAQFDVGRSSHQDELEAIATAYQKEEDKRNYQLRKDAQQPASVSEALWRAEQDDNSPQAKAFDKGIVDNQIKQRTAGAKAYTAAYTAAERSFKKADGTYKLDMVPTDLQDRMVDPDPLVQRAARQELNNLIKEDALARFSAADGDTLYPELMEQLRIGVDPVGEIPAAGTEDVTDWTAEFKIGQGQ